MHDLYKLKDNLVKELEELGKQDLSKSTLDTVDKLAHAAKNVAKVIECCEKDEYSMAMGGGDADVHSYYRGPECQTTGGVWILHVAWSRFYGCYAAVSEGNDSYTLHPLYCRWHLFASLCTDYLSLVPFALVADSVVFTR